MNIINCFVVAHEAENEHMIARNKRNRRLRNIAAEAFNISDEKFVKLFRLTKPLVRTFIRDLSPYMKQRQRKSMLDVKIKVCSKILYIYTHTQYHMVLHVIIKVYIENINQQ